jgi:uncharacterized protein (DUF927 family)
MNNNGLFITIKGKEGSPDKKEKICAAFEILGATRDTQGASWGKYLRWNDADGRTHTRHVSDAMLQGDATTLCAILADEGLAVCSKSQQRNLQNYLSGAHVQQRATLVSRTGWHSINGANVFVLANEAIGPQGAEHVILEGAQAAPYETQGSLNDWQNSVGRLAAQHPLAILAISASLAGPLLFLSGQEGGGVNFFGPSSQGKTTLLQIAATVWGRGAQPGYLRAWRATANGLEGAAATACDTALILDELGVVDARDAASGIYSLGNGSGKARAGRNGDLRETKSWRIFLISSGELPVSRKLNENKSRKAMAGQLVRLLDIPADAGEGFGAFSNGGESNDAAQVAKAFKTACTTHYGTAGPAFVRALIEEQVDGEAIRSLVNDFVAKVACATDGQIVRAAQRFGLIGAAGMLAAELGICPWSPVTARHAAEAGFKSWLANRGGVEPAEVTQAIATVRLCIEQFGASKFQNLDDVSHRVNERLGWTCGNGSEQLWMIPPESWKAVCTGHDAKLVAKVLGERGMLLKSNDGWQCVRRIDDAPKRVYVVTAAIFDGERDGA